MLTTAGEYIWCRSSACAPSSFDAPRRPRDLFWRRCAIELKDGTEGVVYMPAIYLGLAAETDHALLLGRATDWTEPADGPVRGRGQRILLVGEEAVPFTDARHGGVRLSGHRTAESSARKAPQRARLPLLDRLLDADPDAPDDATADRRRGAGALRAPCAATSRRC